MDTRLTVEKSAVIEMIYAEIQREGSQKNVAKKWKISEQYLSDVYRGNREPGQKILEQLGLRKVVTYRVLPHKWST